MKKTALILAIAIFGVIGVSANTSKPIGMKKAKEIAVKQVGGKIIHSKTIKEKGKPEYLIEVKSQNGDLTKLKIDSEGSVIDSATVASSPKEKVEKSNKKKHWWKF